MKQSNSDPEGAPRPEDFPLGSPESRAAARALLQEREEPGIRVRFICYIPTPGLDPSLIHVKPTQPGGMQIIQMLSGMQWPPDDPSRVCWDCRCEETFRSREQKR